MRHWHGTVAEAARQPSGSGIGSRAAGEISTCWAEWLQRSAAAIPRNRRLGDLDLLGGGGGRGISDQPGRFRGIVGWGISTVADLTDVADSWTGAAPAPQRRRYRALSCWADGISRYEMGPAFFHPSLSNHVLG